MSRLQSYVLWAGAAILLTLLLFPPYYMPQGMNRLADALAGAQGVQALHIIQYSFLFLPPAGSTSILWLQYLIPQLVVALFTFGLVNILKARTGSVVQIATQAGEPAV